MQNIVNRSFHQNETFNFLYLILLCRMV